MPVLVVVSLLISAWNSYQASERAQCQADLNNQFLTVISQNSEQNQADRDNLSETIRSIGESDSREETREILDAYEQRRAEIDAQREEYPPPPEDVCA